MTVTKGGSNDIYINGYPCAGINIYGSVTHFRNAP